MKFKLISSIKNNVVRLFILPPCQHVTTHSPTHPLQSHAFPHLVYSCVHLLPEWVSLLQRPLHPRSLVLWWRSRLLWQLWWTPLLQWVPAISLTHLKWACGLCVSARPIISCHCVFVSVPSASVCMCEQVMWVLRQRVWVSGAFLCVGAVVSQASYCMLHSLVVTPLSMFWQAAPPPSFCPSGLQRLTLAFL